MKNFLITIGVLLAIIVIGAGVFISTFDANKYRAQVAETLSKKTGREVKLNGPLKLGLSPRGVVLNIQDASIGNPSWASRPQMASIGRFKLAIAVMPLLDHQVSITGLEVDDADILLESSANGLHNWPTAGQASANPANATPSQTLGAPPVSVRVDHISIKNSQIAMRAEDGKTTVFKTEDLELAPKNGGMALRFTGEYNGLPIILNVKTNGDELTSLAARPFDADLTFANFRFVASGSINAGEKKATVDSYGLTADKSGIHGQLTADWSGPKTLLEGNILSDHFDPADFKMPAANVQSEQGASTTAEAASNPERVFSDAPLNFDALKSANAKFDVTIAELPLGAASLTQVNTKLSIENGRLFLSPFKAVLGGGTFDGQINLTGGETPAHLGMTFAASDVDISELLQLGGIEAFLSGKVNADMNIATSGNSIHQFASNANGSFNVIGAGGDVVSGAADKVNAGLAELFSGGGGNGNESMNCIVARFTAANGIVRDNGILADTAATTVAGGGGFDLRSETIDLLLRAKPKLVSTGGLLPPVHVGGTLLHPNYAVSASSVLQNVTGLLTGGGTLNDNVPNITAAQGQNACLYTLEHPSSASASSSPSKGGVVQDLISKAGPAATHLGNKLKGLLGQ